MPSPWDEMMKRLIESHPQDFVSWVLQGARVEGILKQELQQTMFADSLIKVVVEGQPAIIHFEFQTVRDPHMGERTSLYNLLASHLNNYIPVWSYVVYLRPDDNLEESPFVRVFPGQKEISRFNYNRIDLWTLSAEELLALPSEGLLPLVLLTSDGTEPNVVEGMIEKVADTGDKELLAAAYTLGGLVFKNQDEQNWFKRRFIMFQDILEESWTYQEMKQEIEQKFLQLELHRQRIALTTIVRNRFPKIARLAKGMASTINDPAILSDLIINISSAQTLEEATDILLAAGGVEEDDADEV